MQHRIPKVLIGSTLILIVLFSGSCKKDDILTDSSARLEFSMDTVMFDTIFTSIGSTTAILTVYNDNDRPVVISRATLATGQNSPYRLNFDGIPGKSFKDVEIAGKDSLFMFIEVTIDPNNVNTPFLVTDSIVFETNGNIQDVDLVAYGQNANFIVADTYVEGLPPYKILPCNSTWDNSLPYVIYGYAVVDSSCDLTINAGTKVYLHNNSGLWVYKGGMIDVNGTVADPVIFQGTRLESYYQDIPGQWDRIWINEGSVNNEIDHAIIRNGFIGIQAESLLDTSEQKQLTIRNTVIHNMSGFGIFTRYYNLVARNVLVTECGFYNLAITRGGGYEFRHCTFANYWNRSQRTTPAVYMNDYGVDQNQNLLEFPLYKADFFNSIIYGNNDDELEFDFEFSTTSHNFNNLLLRGTISTPSSNFTNVIKNQDPKFFDVFEDDYHINSNSPARDAGDPAFVTPDIQSDLDGNPRLIDTAPDLGVYEFL
jgi:hypothetical protein